MAYIFHLGYNQNDKADANRLFPHHIQEVLYIHIAQMIANKRHSSENYVLLLYQLFSLQSMINDALNSISFVPLYVVLA